MNNICTKKGDEILTQAVYDFLKIYAEEAEKFKKIKKTESLTKEITDHIFTYTIDVLYEKYKTPLKDWVGIETKFSFVGKLNHKKKELREKGNGTCCAKAKREGITPPKARHGSTDLEIPFFEKEISSSKRFYQLSVVKPPKFTSLEEEIEFYGLNRDEYF